MRDDVWTAWRFIIGAPLPSAAIVASLAAAIGVNAIVFSWVQARVRHPIPGAAHAARFLLVEPRTEAGAYPGVSWQEYEDLRRESVLVEALVAARMTPLYVGEPERVERVFGQLVSANYFAVLGVQPRAGRLFDENDGRRSAPPGAVIAAGLARTAFGDPARAVGATMRVNGRPLPVVGVVPDEFQGTVAGLDVQIWLPAAMAPAIVPGSRELEDRRARGYALMAALARDVPAAAAQRELDTAMRRLARDFPRENPAVGAELLPQWRAPRGPQRMLTGALAILQGVMLLVLLAVCANVATLVLARASTRRHDLGLRLALGASHARLARPLLIEHTLLASAGALIGLALAWWGTRALQMLPARGGLPVRFQTRVDGAVAVFGVALGLLAATLVSLAAAWQLARLDPQSALRATAATSRSRLRHGLLAVQSGLAVIVLLMAGALIRSYAAAQHLDPGFTREGVLLAGFDASLRGLSDEGRRLLAAGLLDRLRALPEVSHAALATNVPLDIHGLPLRTFSLEGRARSDQGRDPVRTNTVTPGYFALMGIPITAGTDFSDLRAPGPAQAVVNQAFADRYAGAATLIGRRLRVGDRDQVIIGVVRTTVADAFGEPPAPVIYLSYRDVASASGEIHVGLRRGSPQQFGPRLRRAAHGFDAGLPVFNLRTLDEHIEANLVLRRVPARMFLVLGPLLVVLTALGVYAMAAYDASRRTNEVAIRAALGASYGRLLRHLVGDNLAVAGGGVLVGSLLALLAAADLGAGQPIDASLFVTVPLLLLAAAAVASWLSARRAARTNPSALLSQRSSGARSG